MISKVSAKLRRELLKLRKIND